MKVQIPVVFTKPVFRSEVWLPLLNFEDCYEISSLGRLRSLKRKGTYNRERKLSTNKKGYLIVKLHKDGKGKTYIFHRLVAKTFISNPHKLPQVNHKDGDKKNNTVSNLEWCNQIQNMAHSKLHGLHKGKQIGEKNGRVKLTEVQAINIRHCKGSISYRKLASIYNISPYIVWAIWNRKVWKHI